MNYGFIKDDRCRADSAESLFKLGDLEFQKRVLKVVGRNLGLWECEKLLNG
jgi:hypothetical protein